LNVPLIRSIIQSESIDRPGHFFGIIGPATFSAAQNLTDELEKYNNILFVGEPTGPNGNHYGDAEDRLAQQRNHRSCCDLLLARLASDGQPCRDTSSNSCAFDLCVLSPKD
jgi:hypothetical protein